MNKVKKCYLSGICFTCGEYVSKSYGPVTRKFLYCNRDCQTDIYGFGLRKPTDDPINWKYGNPWFDDNHFKQSFLDEYLQCKA